MPIQTMTIAFVNPPKIGKGRGSIKGTDGTQLGCFADKLHLFDQGQTYDVEFTETVSNGVTYRNVKTATLIAPEPRQPAAPVRSAASPPAQVPRTASPAPAPPSAASGDINRQTHPIDAERMWVCATLTAFIKAGKVDLDPRSLGEATMMLRRLWQYSFAAQGGTFGGETQQRQVRG